MLFFLARAYEHGGQTGRAEARYREAVSIDRTHSDSQLGIARIDLAAGRVEQAGRAAATVLAALPDDTDALLVAGLSAQRSGRNAEARRHLERAVTLAEHYVDVHIALGIVNFDDSRIADARRHFERAVELDQARRGEIAVWLQRTAGGE
jgi:tetratricopeptide (TPR) repeat protein